MFPSVGVQLMLASIESVNDEIFHSGNEMLINVQVVLWEIVIKVLLEHMVADSVAIFMLTVVASKLLQTIVGQMHVVIAVSQVVIIR